MILFLIALYVLVFKIPTMISVQGILRNAFLLCVADFCACLFQYGGYEDFLFRNSFG